MIKAVLNPFKKAELPIKIFEASSMVERSMRKYANAPYFLSKAAEIDETVNPGERLRLVIAMAISGLKKGITFKKSFDPVIGETYQGIIRNERDECNAYVEQISHHPPVSSFLIEDKKDKFKLYGSHAQ